VHVSVTFTYDKPIAERLAEQWRHVAPDKIGGVAYGDDSLEFIPAATCAGLHDHVARLSAALLVLRRVEEVAGRQPLPIYDGWNVLDDNLLACPRHVEAVFAMLRAAEVRRDWPATDGDASSSPAASRRSRLRTIRLICSRPAAAAELLLRLRPGRRVRDARERRAPAARAGFTRNRIGSAATC
jgi:hypothetical protein